MNINNLNELKSKHPNYDEEIKYVNKLVEDVLTLSKANLLDYVQGARITHSKKYAFSSQYKEVYYGGLYSRVELAYNYNKDGSIFQLNISNPNIINELVSSASYDEVTINYNLGWFWFYKSKNMIAKLECTIFNNQVSLNDYWLV